MTKHTSFSGGAGRWLDTEIPPRAPRWVRAFGVAAIVVLLLVVVMLVSGHGGPHSPLHHFQHGASVATPHE